MSVRISPDFSGGGRVSKIPTRRLASYATKREVAGVMPRFTRFAQTHAQKNQPEIKN